MTYSTMIRTAALVLAAAAIVGCKSDTEPIPGLQDDADVYPRVTLTSRSLQDGVGVGEPLIAHTPVGNLQVTLPIRARTKDPAHIEYRIVWFDESGQVIRPEMTWTPKRLEPKQPDQLTFTASSAAAVDYNIQIRWGLR